MTHKNKITSATSPILCNTAANINAIFDLLIVCAEKVNFIDFEFAAYNYQAFDIAMHFCDYGGNNRSSQ